MAGATQTEVLIEARVARIEANLEGVQKGLGQVDETLKQVVNLISAQARNNEQIKTLFRVCDGMESDVKELKSKVGSLDTMMAEWRPVLESIQRDHDATTKNSFVSRGVLTSLRVLLGVAAGALAGYIASGHGGG